jgi:hypothetical protein
VRVLGVAFAQVCVALRTGYDERHPSNRDISHERSEARKNAPNREEIHMSQGDPTEPVVEQAPTEQAPAEQAPAATEQAPVEQAPEEQQQVAASEPEPVAASPVADTTVASDSPTTEA